MKLVLRWTAALITLAVIAWIWFARDASTNSSAAAAPNETGRELETPTGDVLVPVETIDDASRSSSERIEASIDFITSTSSTAATEELAIVRVRVISEDTGGPLAGWRAFARTNPPSRERWTSAQADSTVAQPGESIATDDQGRAALAVLPHHAHTLLVTFPGNSSRCCYVEVTALEPGATFDVELQFPTEPDLTFFGLVLDADTRAPIAGAVVHFATESWKGDADTHARSDAHGVFELDARSWLDAQVRLDAEGYGPAIVALTAGHATRADAFEIGLSRVGTLEVLVIDKGVPSANAQVSATTDRFYFEASDGTKPYADDHSDPSWSARSGDDGVARFLEMPSRVPLELDVRTTSKSRANVRDIQLEPGDTRRVEVVVDPHSTISGRVETAAGEPVAGVTVWLVQARRDATVLLQPHDTPFDGVTSDVEGRFQFRDVLKGRWHVGLAPASRQNRRSDPKREHALVPLAELVQLDGINTSVEIVVRALEGRFIRGTTLAADGKPVACNILALQADGWTQATDLSNAAGAFEIGPLPDGEFVLVALGADERGAESKPLTVSSGTSGVELRLMPACSVTFRIAPRGGEQLDADLFVFGASEVMGARVNSTVDGVCIWTGLPEGPLTVKAETSSGLCAVRSGIELRASPIPTEVELHLEPGAKLALRYEGPLEFEVYEVLFDGARIELGGSRLDPMLVPAGSIEVRKVPRDGRPPEMHRLTLAPGEVRELVLGK